jgi:4-hydroxy-4-methyl-2-oxoglutarate aldolase
MNQNTASIDDIKTRLNAALLSDALDEVGLRYQALSAHTRPLDARRVMCGRARTAIYVEVCQVVAGRNPYELEIALVDSLQPGEVAVMACGGSQRIAPWGALLSTASHVRRAAGCVTDGFVRDTQAILGLDFPVFHRGIAPLDSKGRGEVQAIDVPVICDGVRVEPGDLVFGDADGVVVIPAQAEQEVLRVAFDKLSKEVDSFSLLRNGTSLRQVFALHGVL